MPVRLLIIMCSIQGKGQEKEQEVDQATERYGWNGMQDSRSLVMTDRPMSKLVQLRKKCKSAPPQLTIRADLKMKRGRNPSETSF